MIIRSEITFNEEEYKMKSPVGTPGQFRLFVTEIIGSEGG